MAPHVIDRLEPIDVDERENESAIRATCPGHLPLEVDQSATTAERAGQHVNSRLRAIARGLAPIASGTLTIARSVHPVLRSRLAVTCRLFARAPRQAAARRFPVLFGAVASLGGAVASLRGAVASSAARSRPSAARSRRSAARSLSSIIKHPLEHAKQLLMRLIVRPSLAISPGNNLTNRAHGGVPNTLRSPRGLPTLPRWYVNCADPLLILLVAQR
jgi:hypothetical protein